MLILELGRLCDLFLLAILHICPGGATNSHRGSNRASTRASEPMGFTSCQVLAVGQLISTRFQIYTRPKAYQASPANYFRTCVKINNSNSPSPHHVSSRTSVARTSYWPHALPQKKHMPPRDKKQKLKRKRIVSISKRTIRLATSS